MSGRPITRQLGRAHVPAGNLPSSAAVGASVSVSGTMWPNGETLALGWTTNRENDPNKPLPTAVTTTASTPGGTWSTSLSAPASAGTYYLATWPAKFPRDISYHGPVTVS